MFLSVGCEDKYTFRGVTCSNPVPHNAGPNFHHLTKVSRLVCRHLCSTLYSADCTGFYYQPNDSLCMLGPHDTRPSQFTRSCPGVANHFEYQERTRCLRELLINVIGNTKKGNISRLNILGTCTGQYGVVVYML